MSMLTLAIKQVTEEVTVAQGFFKCLLKIAPAFIGEKILLGAVYSGPWLVFVKARISKLFSKAARVADKISF